MSSAQWRSVTSTPTSSINAIDSAGDVYLLATGTGVYRSSNALSWNRSSLGLAEQRYVSIVQHNDQAYVATAAGQVYRSPDFGTVWVPHGNVPSQSALVCLEAAHGNVYALTHAAVYVYKQGVWEHTGVLSPGNIQSTSVVNGVMYVCTSDRGVFEFTENGMFADRSNGLFDLNVREVLGDGDILYALTQSQGVFSLDPHVGEWQQLSKKGIEDLSGRHLFVAHNTLCASFFGGKVFSYDGYSRTWYLVEQELPTEAESELLFSVGGHFFVGTRLRGLWRTNAQQIVVGVQQDEHNSELFCVQPAYGYTSFLAERSCLAVMVGVDGRVLVKRALEAGQMFETDVNIPCFLVVRYR